MSDRWGMVPIMTTMHHPWRRLRARPDIVVDWGHLPPGVKAQTDGHRRIWLDRYLLQVGRRCAIDHELAHIELGHTCGADDAQELAAQKMSARRLIKIDDLSEAARWSTDMSELADILWVTQDVLIVRMQHLHPAERAALMAATVHHRGD